MRSRVPEAPQSSKQRRKVNPQKPAGSRRKKLPHNLASLIRGLYGRAASRLGVDPSYVSRVARGERRSAKIESELRRELNRILKAFRNKRRNMQRGGTRKRAK